MGARAAAGTLIFAASLPWGACGDPVLILGDLPGVVRVVVGAPGEAGIATDSLALETLLTDPAAVAALDDGGFVVADRTGRLLEVDAAGRVRTLLSRLGCAGAGCLVSPEAVAVLPDGSLLVADAGANRLVRVDRGTGAVTRVAGTGEAASAADGSLASSSPLHEPAGLAVAEDGRVFVSERGAHRVRVIDAAGVLGTVADPTGAPGLLRPSGLAWSGGLLYVADTGGHRVRRADPVAGTIETVAGTGIASFGGDGGPAVESGLRFPIGVAVAPAAGVLYISDTVNDRVRVVNLRSGRIDTFAGPGEGDAGGDGLPAARTGLDRPTALSLSGRGHLFIADTDHHVVRRTLVEF